MSVCLSVGPTACLRKRHAKTSSERRGARAAETRRERKLIIAQDQAIRLRRLGSS